jgi:ABC-2 type transport system permease protein
VSVQRTLTALPTLMRVGLAEAVAYRAEMLVWILATTMPLVMMALFTAVARDAPIGRFGEHQFVAYFLCTFIVRQVVGSWASWQMNMEIKDGTLALRLLRPVSPLVNYAIENLVSIPVRSLVAVPMGIVLLVAVGAGAVTHQPVLWLLWLLAMIGSWALTLLVNLAIGSLAFFFESSVKLMDIWTAAFFVLSGYLLPVELFPSWMRPALDWLPFRYQIGLPVEIMIGTHTVKAALVLLAHQWSWVLVFVLLTERAWSLGVKRFAAYGG